MLNQSERTGLQGQGTSPVRRDASDFGFIQVPARPYAESMQLPSLTQIREAQSVVYRHMPPTP
ncbi:MAG: hypothetical protein WBQ94_04780, partial [Terracidiphilus sp.]